MALSAPIFQLKQKAKRLSREQKIPLHEALDRMAKAEGFGSWSLLSARTPASKPEDILWNTIAPGDLVLIGARPRQGKTLMGVRLAVTAMRSGRASAFFSLDYTTFDMHERFRAIDIVPMDFADQFSFYDSDRISAGYIIEALEVLPEGSLAVIDYLQLLDQRRENPELDPQVRELRAFARKRGVILVFLSQIDRSFELSGKALPGFQDVRLPNPLDLTLFDKACFLNKGSYRLEAAA